MRSVSINGTRRVFLRDVAAFYRMGFQRADEQVVLASREARLEFWIDKRVALVNGVKVHLSWALGVWQDHVVVSEVDFRSLIDPLLQAPARAPVSARRIMLDPGHGGGDQGTRGVAALEKDITLALAQRLARQLRRYGYEVKLTRTDDVTVLKPERTQRAADWRADLFVSLHANFAETRQVSGVETFMLSPVGTPSTYEKTAVAAKGAGNRYDLLNARLAYEIQRCLVACTRSVDRGVKHARFAVLRQAPCPAVLVECGFLSNAAEEQRLMDTAYQSKLVAGFVYALRRFQRSVQGRGPGFVRTE